MFAMPIPEMNGPGRGASATGTTYSGSGLAQLLNFHGGGRTTWFRVDLLHNDRSYKSDLTAFATKMVIRADATQAVGRTLDLDMVETTASQSVTITGGGIAGAGIDYLNDFAQPVCLIKSPGGWLHFPLGVFRFTRPGVTVPGYAIVRHATMPDLTSVVQQNQATDSTNNGTGIPLTLPPGAYVIDVITSLLVNATSNVPSNPATLANLPGCALGTFLPSNVSGSPAGNTPGDWPTNAQIDAKIPSGGYTVSEGQSYLDLINHLLYTIGCYNLMADHNGIFRIQQWPPNQNYTGLSSLYTYDTTVDSIVSFGLTEDILVDNIYNVVEVIVEDGYRNTFKATAANTDAGSPYSVATIGRRVNTVRDPGVPDVGSSGVNYAQLYAKQQLLMAQWLTDVVTLPTAVNPLHAGGMDHDIVSLNIYQQFYAAGSAQNVPVIVGITIPPSGSYPGLVSTEKFMQTGWTITAELAQPGTAGNIAGNVGLTTLLEPRDDKQGHTMSQTLQRITTTINPANVTVS